VKNLSHWQRHKRDKSGGMPSQRHPHHVLAEATLDTTLAVALQCAARSLLAPGSKNCVPCAPCTYGGTTDSDPAAACAPCTAGLTSHACPPACPVVRLGPEHIAVIWNCAWDETGASASIGVSSPVSSPFYVPPQNSETGFQTFGYGLAIIMVESARRYFPPGRAKRM
jgi:hypothetical protein